jgi:cell division protein FtsZ
MYADDVLRQGVVGISDIIVKPGLVNVDFADVRTILSNSGMALMGLGRSNSRGSSRAVEAARAALSSPLLDFQLKNAKV